MTKKYLKSLLLIGTLGATALLAACEAPSHETEVEQLELETQTVDAEAAEDAAEDAVAEAPEVSHDAPPVESVPLGDRSSEESVQPDSETLFY